MAKPVLSVVICTYNRSDLLPIVLESMTSQSIDQSQFEVIIVDNNSTDNSADIAQSFCEKYSHFRLIHEPAQGLSNARNRGWKDSRGTYIAFLDDDAQADKSWCERIVNAFTTVKPQPVAVGGQIRPHFQSPPPEWFMDSFEVRSWGDKPHFLDSPYARFGFSGSNMAFLKKVLEQSNGFSPHLGITGATLRMGEESDLFSRIYQENPLFWYDPDILVYHWTPERNFSVMYRFKRLYQNGVFMAYAQHRSIFSLNYLRMTLYLTGQIILFPIRMIRHRDKKTFVILMQKIARSLGYLTAKNAK